MRGAGVGARTAPFRCPAATSRAVSRPPRGPLRPRAIAAPSAVPFLPSADHLQEWGPQSWKQREALQQPNYPNQAELDEAVAQIAAFPPLVFAGECRTLQSRVAAAAAGEAFLVQGGDCAEAFSQFNANRIRDLFRLLLQMSVVLMYGGGVPVVKIGRLAGQFAKPRSADLETVDGQSLPSYRGDIINGPEFTPEARVPDPARLVRGYNQSAATLNLLRGFATGGYAALDRVMQWNLDFTRGSEEGRAYRDLASRIEESITFMRACGLDMHSAIMRETDFYVSHEALLLDYEAALTREDSTTGLWYGCSGHFLWCGERTRQLDGAHVEYLRGVGNPLGVKVSDKADPADLVALIAALNPENTPGRLAVIVRMGAAKLRERLPALLAAVGAAGQVVTWICDPMHGNTEAVQGYKTRRFENVRAELEAFFDVHEAAGTVPGGMHLEMTGDDVTECIGGGAAVTELDLSSRYHTHCDPRLNAEQALELAFYVASRLRRRRAARDAEQQRADGAPAAAARNGLL
ncbi:DHAPS1 [Auxenochlorella protothecoides x Auxenochlorella symbiontica]